MDSILEWLVTAEDARQQAKVKRLMRDIIAIVFFAELANATEWIEIYLNRGMLVSFLLRQETKGLRMRLFLYYYIILRLYFSNHRIIFKTGIKIL